MNPNSTIPPFDDVHVESLPQQPQSSPEAQRQDSPTSAMGNSGNDGGRWPR